MSASLNDKEIEAAQVALIAWFKSQDISPAHGAQIMISLIAIQMVTKTTDIDQLQKAIRHTTDLLTVEVAGYVREELKK